MLFRLSQNGAALPCINPAGKPRELDLFISPNGPNAKPPRRSAMPLSGPNSPLLGQMQNLFADVTVSVSGQVSTATRCAVNKGSPTAAVILHNTHTTPPQTLFYQLILRPFCADEPGIAPPNCVAQQHHLEPFARENPFGVNDYLTRLGQPYLELGVARHLRVNLLPALKQALTGVSAALDADPSHWVVDGVYLGQIIFGDVLLRSDWQAFRLEAIMP
jgi:hypothetical protein